MSSVFSVACHAAAVFALGALSALVPAAPAHAAPAEGVVEGAGSPDAVPGRYIVMLKNQGLDASAQSLYASAEGLVGSGLVKTFGSIHGFSATLSAVEARRLAADPQVQVVEQDRRVRIANAQRNPTWGLDRIDQRSRKLSKAYLPTADGNSVHAYVIDTGIRVSHSEFGGRASYGYDFVDGERQADDCNGHGTHVAGTIGGARYGVAKKVKLVAVRVLDCDGRGTTWDIVEGINWVTEHAMKPAVANMSIGGGSSDALDSAVQDSIASGVTYVVAAGNEDDYATNYSPADVSAAITVGATDALDRRATFSNYGRGLDLFAPGVQIRSAYIGGRTATKVLSGTSMATPHVTGAVALLLDQWPTLSPAKVRDHLVKHSTTGKVSDRYSGSPNRFLFVSAPPKTKIKTASLPAAGYADPLPEGLTLTASGLVAGVPTGAGKFTFAVQFRDLWHQAVTRTVSLLVASGPPLISTDYLPDSPMNQAYSEQLTTADGRAGVWSIVDGSLPSGLSLSPTGLISGIPDQLEFEREFTVQFEDLLGNVATANLTIYIHDYEF